MQEQIKVCEGTKPEEIGMLQQLAKDSGLFNGEAITEITYMPGGLTNRNFRIVIGGKKFAFRLAGAGTAEYLNRPGEKQAVGALKDLNICPEFYYYDVSTGSNVARFVEGDTMSRKDFQTRKDVLEKAAIILKKYHDSGIIFEGRFDPVAEINSYQDYLKKNHWTKFYDGMDELNQKFNEVQDAFKKNPPKLICSHNDVLSENFIYDGKKMELIDWEYCGMNIYNFDVAAIIIENRLSPEKEGEFLKYYYGAEPTEAQLADVLIGKFLVDGLWCPWALVQMATKPGEEDFYWDYGLDRITRCNQYMADPNFDRYVKMIAGN